MIGGLCQEATERMTAAGGAFHPPAAEWGSDDPELREASTSAGGCVWGGAGAHHRVRYAVAFDPEVLRQVLFELVREAGVDLLLHMWGADALVEDDRVRGVVFQSKAGRRAILADVVDRRHRRRRRAGLGGLRHRAGDGPPVAVVPDGRRRATSTRRSTRGAASSARPTRASCCFRGAAWRASTAQIDPTDPRDLTFAEVECRRLVMEEVRKLRDEVPGMERAHLCNIATQLGITESRRLVGRFVLTRDQMNADVDDAICITGHWTKYGAVYAIPYRCLQTREFANLLAAGRMISVDHRVHHATKEIPACMAVGEAAGCAAALALCVRRRRERGGRGRRCAAAWSPAARCSTTSTRPPERGRC